MDAAAVWAVEPHGEAVTDAPTLVVGASARAAVASARRAGWRPAAIDLFADRDTQALAITLRCPIEDYPQGWVELAAKQPPGPWFYTGGLENHPDVVQAISETRNLLGHGPDVIDKVRDETFLKQTLRDIAVSFPARQGIPGPGIWLRKKPKSSGGLGVQWALDDTSPLIQGEYFQEFIKGLVVSAQYRGGTFLGATEVICGDAAFHAPAFHYAGNIGPIPLSAQQKETFLQLGDVLAKAAGLTWLWGMDFIQSEQGLVVLEVNPRMTAALEVLEHAQGTSLCVDGPGLARAVVGKAIVYAPFALNVVEQVPWEQDLAQSTDVWRLAQYADLPHTGERFDVGWPVVTVFAKGYTRDEVRKRLEHSARQLDEYFTLWRTP